MNLGLLDALDQLEEEKGISKDEIIEILEKALVSAYKKNFGTAKNVDVKIDRMTGDIQLFQVFDVVEEVEDPLTQMSVEEARKADPLAESGKKIFKKISVKNFGRIAAQTAKQVLIQRIRELEKERQYEHYSTLAGSVITVEVIRVTSDWADIRVGKIETRLPKREWISGESISAGELIKVYVQSVVKDKKGPKIMVSRAVPEFVAGLLKLEIPEIENDIVQIKAIVREPGVRTKVAVVSTNPQVDPVGACIGEGGSRISAILRELKGEKVDIFRWTDDPRQLIVNALAPASVTSVEILDFERKAVRVLVPPTQLSLAIGKGGQNARLAAKLTGWKIDIKPVMNV
ncbi:MULTISPECIES: transcription termination factor NusA [Pseudothermotoga]|jgi:N utilization substance protein A|uniref:Transcription termination/antitermination protein NusA n=1 Tax=Pseudothermotoga lettingae (strain ATCC BAA-301 / DSM 14385 / NBRC 107922 / TMO) TaxID=416591 RepID=A8F3W1_PSELT|nr:MULTISPECIES: transcription termination factor NusA [Pseudothermotoga]ABV32845.1 NusA antitermination factor [Pseudothermotoga lettingae TMO]KUK21435.1 MAG: NusA antitermination factor [Pseudothermotoga lettingae]MDI3494092.1 transcription termination/antitermination protein NusA [Pseudothermotoga sp.]MDK2884892.1 transcription termination/antitermination protein NusA [Pseudothermotoga sp.]GLI48159.1 transcription termination/antitermination protein NusA [Pseudothermotoga lettingae TMO]